MRQRNKSELERGGWAPAAPPGTEVGPLGIQVQAEDGDAGLGSSPTSAAQQLALGMSLHLSEPQFPNLENGANFGVLVFSRGFILIE